jgi:hypothetical protein
MNPHARLAVAAAAVVLVTVVACNNTPDSGQSGASSTTPPSAVATVAASPSARPGVAFPPIGPLAVGRHTFTEDDLEFTLAISEAGWVSEGYGAGVQGGTIAKGSPTNADAAWVLIWSVDGVYTDPCAHVAGPVTSGSPADLAAAVAALPNGGSTGPVDATIDGYAAKHVTIAFAADVGCAPDHYYTWYNNLVCGDFDPCHRWLSAANSTLRVWIVDLGGTHFWIEAETYDGATTALDLELSEMVESIQFE